MNYLRIFTCATAIVFSASGTLVADVKMSTLFGDHMVLQQAGSVPVWGTADPGEQVTVTVGAISGSATAGSDGKWMVKLAPLAAGTTPVTMTVVGKNSLTFQDVLVGDVWICSGQSNMEFGVPQLLHAPDVVSQANNPLIRLFVVPHKASLSPLSEVPGDATKPLLGHWQICTPQAIQQDGTWSGFTAVGYFFGREIQKTTGNPVGLIGSYVGGTPAQSWTALSGLQREPALQHYVDDNKKVMDALPQATANFAADQAAYVVAKAKWDQDYGNAFGAVYHAWNLAQSAALAAGKPAPPRPNPPVPAPKAPSLDGSFNDPTTLFNGMIAPLIPFAIKGVIWYQGEANDGQPTEYRALFGSMITDWREKWDEGNFPFLYVQLAGFKPPGEKWALLRESQLDTLALPNTAMATAVDIGDPSTIHPTDKVDVGLRLALAAKHLAYGQDVVYSGPLFDKMQVEGGAIRVSFKQLGSGLVIGSPPYVAPSATAPPTDELVGFAIAGDDKKWVPADAKIDGDTVVVASPQVPSPTQVRYGWDSLPQINLYNKEGLPASPFRTDDWPPSRVVLAPASAPPVTQ